MTQQSLPLDKREYRARVEALEALTPDATELSRRRLKLVQDLLKRIFKHRLSSAEGDITFVQTESPKRGQFSLAAEFFRSRRTIQDWISWAKSAGIVDTAVDCDSFGDRRTTLSINWSTIKKLAAQSAVNVEQSAVVADQSAVNVDQSAGTAPSTKPIPENPKSQGERVGDLENRIGKLGVVDIGCVQRSINAGVKLETIELAIKSAEKHSPPGGTIRGRILALVSNPKLADKPWPHQIEVVAAERQSDRNHESEKLKRRDEVRQSGETELTSSLADAIAEELEFECSLENRFGDLLDGLGEEKRFELAKRFIGDYEANLSRRNPSVIRPLLLSVLSELETIQLEALK